MAVYNKNRKLKTAADLQGKTICTWHTLLLDLPTGIFQAGSELTEGSADSVS